MSNLRIRRRRLILLILPIACLLTVVVSLRTVTAWTTDTVRASGDWRRVLDDAKVRARSGGKRTLIYIAARGSTIDRAVEDDLWSDGATRRALRRYELVRVDVSEDLAAAGAFHATRLPTFVVLDPMGIETHRMTGVFPAEEFALWLEGIGNGRRRDGC